MKTIKIIVQLLMLSLLWGCFGQYLIDLALYLNAQFDSEIPSYIMGAICGLILLLVVWPMVKLFFKFVFGLSYFSIKSILVWSALLLLGYYASDIVTKGQALNELTHYPILGYVFWAAIVLFLYYQVLQPICCFINLPVPQEMSEFRCSDIALRYMRQWLRENKKLQTDDSLEAREKYGKIDELYSKISNAKGQRDMPELQLLLKEFDEHPEMISKKSSDVIIRYSVIGAMTVVLSRNKFIDGIALIFIQLRLVMELARLHGYKTTPVFAFLCLCWIFASSYVFVAINDWINGAAADVATETIADAFADVLVDDPDVQYDASSSAAEGIPFVSGGVKAIRVIVRPLLEASLAGSSVYLCGQLYLRMLRGNRKSFTFSEIRKLRNSGHMQVLKSIFSALGKKVSSAFGINLKTDGILKKFEKKEEPEL